MSEELKEEIKKQIHESEQARRRESHAKWKQKNRSRINQYQRGRRSQLRTHKDRAEEI